MIPAGKTPITCLQDLCNKTGTTPQYDVIANEGTSVHQPEFVIQVTVGDNVSTGRGSSKKKAKHAAAMALLQKLSGNTANPENQAQSNGSVDGDGDLSGQNPIGELQEFTQKKHLRPPEFCFADSMLRAPSEVEFCCICNIGKLSEKGIGTSKKSAKRNAALNMLAYVKSVEGQKCEVNQDDEEEEEDLQLMIDVKNKIEQAKQRGTSIPVGDESTQQQVHKFYLRIMKAGAPSLDGQLAEGVNFEGMLRDIAQSHKFEIKYIDVEETSKSGQHQCLLQLSALPVAVVHGTGPSMAEAHSQAAYNALQYLKVMLRDL